MKLSILCFNNFRRKIFDSFEYYLIFIKSYCVFLKYDGLGHATASEMKTFVKNLLLQRAPSWMLLGVLDAPQIAATTFFKNPVEQKIL